MRNTSNKSPGQARLIAMYNRPTLSGVLDATGATLPLRYQRAGNVVTILPANR